MSDSGLHIDIGQDIGALTLSLAETWGPASITALFGPSGSGKTSVLRLIAGFTQPDRGRISLDGDVWCDRDANVFVPPHIRPIGMVHQGGHLLPKTVSKNLSYAETRSVKRSTQPSSRSWDRAAIIDIFELGNLLDRTPDRLSGGERQRVALAQVLLSHPRLLLLDEPLSALDAKSKTEILSILSRFSADHSVPMVYVSHDLGEVARLADTVAIIKGGKILQTGGTVAMLNAHGFGLDGLARAGSVLEGAIIAHEPATHLMRIAVGPHMVTLPLDETRMIGSKLRIIIHASNVVLSTQAPIGLSVQNALVGTITKLDPDAQTALAYVTLNLDGTDAALVASVTRAAVADLGLLVGQKIYALVKTAILAD